MTRRLTPLPANWQSLRRQVAARDRNLCQLRLPGCLGYAPLGRGGETDHILGGDKGGDHSLANLRHVCSPCHLKRTARQANAAKLSRKRPLPRHPGLTR